MYIPVTFDHSGIQRNEAIEIKVRNFKDLNLQERHIEEFLRKNINLLFGDEQTLLVVGQQVRNASNGISDLTAIDADGNVVLIEIKRDVQDIKARKEPFEFQAIRYAASYAKISTPDSGFNRSWLPRMDQLFEWELIKAGDSIEIKEFESSEAIIIDDTLVRFNGEEISYNNWGKKVTGWSSISIYEWAMLSSIKKTLHELRMEKMAELEAKGSPWEE